MNKNTPKRAKKSEKQVMIVKLFFSMIKPAKKQRSEENSSPKAIAIIKTLIFEYRLVLL